MALFNFRRKNLACTCNCNCPTEETTTSSKAIDGIWCIKVLGTGCATCHQQYEYAKEAAKNMGLSVEVKYITDMAKVMEYGVMSMPALVVNETVVSKGKVLKVTDIEKLLHKLGL